MGDPVLIGTRDITPGRPRVHFCTDCERDADRAEHLGKERPVGRPVRSWVSEASGQTVYGALCMTHSNLEHCRRFQCVRRAHLEDRERLIALDERHEDRLRKLRMVCVCAKALEYQRKIEEHDGTKDRPGLPLHPCASGCGRRLVEGVNRCFSCQRQMEEERRLGAAE